MRNELLVYTLGREQCVNDNVFEWLYLRWGAVILRSIIRRSGRIYRVRVIGNTSFSIEIGFPISLNRSGFRDWNERKYRIRSRWKKQINLFQGRNFEGKSFFFNREKAEYDFLFYCKFLKSVYFFLTFCTLYSRDIIIRMLLLLRYNISRFSCLFFRNF